MSCCALDLLNNFPMKLQMRNIETLHSNPEIRPQRRHVPAYKYCNYCDVIRYCYSTIRHSVIVNVFRNTQFQLTKIRSRFEQTIDFRLEIFFFSTFFFTFKLRVDTKSYWYFVSYPFENIFVWIDWFETSMTAKHYKI